MMMRYSNGGSIHTVLGWFSGINDIPKSPRQIRKVITTNKLGDIAKKVGNKVDR